MARRDGERLADRVNAFLDSIVVGSAPRRQVRFEGLELGDGCGRLARGFARLGSIRRSDDRPVAGTLQISRRTGEFRQLPIRDEGCRP